MVELLITYVERSNSVISLVISCTSTCTLYTSIYVARYASEQCALFSSYVPNIDKAGIGVQVKYSSDRTWQSCAIFCKVNTSPTYLTIVD